MIQMISDLKQKLASIEPDAYFTEKIRAVPIEMKLTFAFSLVFMFMVHGFGFSNKFLNEDSLFYFHTSMAYLYNLGRWMLVSLQFMRGFYTAPWIIGFFAAFYMAIANALLVSVLEVKNKLYCVIISFLIVAYPAWANQFMYDFLADAYPAAMLLAVLAIYLSKKYKYGFIFGAFSLMLSLALYQSFLAFAVGLSLLVVTRHALEGDKSTREIGHAVLKFALCGILGVALYLLSVRVSLLIAGGQLTSYQGMDSLGRVALGQLPRHIAIAYARFFQGFLITNEPLNWLYVSAGLFFLYAVVFCLAVYMLVRVIAARRRDFGAYVAIAGCLLFLPVGLNITAVTAPMAMMHTLVTNAFVLGVVLIFVLLEIYRERASFYLKIAVMAVTVLIGGNYWRQSSGLYFVQHVQYERTLAFYNRLLLRIESAEGFEPGMPVAIVGTEPFHYIGASDVMTGDLRQIVGFSGDRPAVGLGEPLKVRNFMQNILGANIIPATHEETERAMATAEFFQMPLYPRYGSVLVIDGVLVVRLNVVYEYDINIAVEGREIVFPARQPFRVDARVIAPAREIFEALGYDLGWDGDAGAVTITGNGQTVSIVIGSEIFTANGESHAADFPAHLIEGHTILEVTALLKSMGYHAGWDINTRSINITSSHLPNP